MMAGYRVAVIADIHGNALALDAVIADLATVPHDETVIAGDLVLNGPRPAESLARVREINVPTIYGNADRYLIDEPEHDNPLFGRAWVHERIGQEGIAYLAALPFSHRVTPPGGASPNNDLLIVHATPTDVDGLLVMESTETLTVTPDDKAAQLLGDARANLIIYGHIHCASTGTVRGRRVASIGSVGFPFDGDPRAAYAVVEWDGENWHVTHHRITYDTDAVIADLGHSDMPFRHFSMRRLRETRWIPTAE